MPRILVILLGFCITTFSASAADLPGSREQIRLTFAPVVKQVSPAVVNIYTRTVIRQSPNSLAADPFLRRFFGEQGMEGLTRDRVQNALGSGVIVGADGIVVTNHHVVAGATEITVVLSDRREYDAKVVGTDERSDLAVLKVNTKGDHLPTLSFADSDQLEVGDLVLAIGNPFGFSQSVTSGIVSALSRSKGPNDYGTFIQTDAAINPGNSGGALVNMAGQLVGINSWIASPTGSYVGIGFAIPSTLVKAVLTSITQMGKVVHPFIGLSGQAVTQEIAQNIGLAKPEGVLINQVNRNGPAAAAGIKTGDIITAINGKPVDDPEAMRFRLATLSIGSTAHLTVLRNGAERNIDLLLSPPPESPPRDTTELKGRSPLTGAVIANINPALAEELDISPEAKGVILLGVKENSTAARFQFQTRDVIISINSVPMGSVEDVKTALSAAVPSWTIAINRQGETLSLTVSR